MPWPFGRPEKRSGANRRARRALRARGESSGDGSALLFEPLEPRVLLNAAPFTAIHINQQQTPPVLQDANGTQLIATLSGAGHVQLDQGAHGPELIVTGTNANSSLVLTVKGGTGHFILNSIDLAGPMNSVSGVGIDLHGKFTAEGPVHSVSLGDLQSSTLIASGSIDSLSLGKVHDSSVSVTGSIGVFSVNSWISTGATNQLNATSIGNLRSSGDFDASLALSGPTGNHAAPTLGLVNVGGTLADGTWYVVGDAGLVVAGQVAANWTGDFTKSVNFTSNRDFDGTLATADLKFFNVGGSLNHAQLLIGADLGPSGRLGDSSNHFGTGTLDFLSVRGSFIGSRIWVGVVPGPSGVYDAGGDAFYGSQANDQIKYFFAGGSLDSTSKVEAGAFTLPVFANGKMFVATTDSHFITHTLNLNPLTLSLALNGGGSNGSVTNNPAATATFQDAGAVVSLVATLDGDSANALNLLPHPQTTGAITISSKQFQSLAGGALKDGPHTLTVVATEPFGHVTTQSLTFTLDTAAPTMTAALTNDTGVSATDRVTSEDHGERAAQRWSG